MRERADADRIRRFMHVLGGAARIEGRCYFAGGATAVMLGWRETTLDVDISLEPEQDDAMRELPSRTRPRGRPPASEPGPGRAGAPSPRLRRDRASSLPLPGRGSALVPGARRRGRPG